MRENTIKTKLKSGQAVLGAFVNLPSPHLVEICGLSGFDFVIIDAEHGPMGPQACDEMVRAAEVVGITPIVRVAQNLPQVILRYLDIGALGVQMPMINTVEDARQVVRSVKYWPVGRRGLASTRAASYGLGAPLGDYVVEANEKTLIVTHVETPEAATNLGQVLEIPEIDVIFIGPTDLSQSMGFPGRPNEPVVQELIAKLIPQIRDAGKAVGTIASSGDQARSLIDRGVTYVAINLAGIIGGGIRAYTKAARSA